MEINQEKQIIGHKKTNKMAQSPYDSVKKSELCVILILLDFPKSLNIVTNSQYAEEVVWHIGTADLI